MPELPNPPPSAIFFENNNLYACLASYPLTKGHAVVVWKEKIQDLHLLKKKDYRHLMDMVDYVRDAMLAVLKCEKVYLLYLDEVKHVHWHLVPRYNEKGFDVLTHHPKKLRTFSLARKIKKQLVACPS